MGRYHADTVRALIGGLVAVAVSTGIAVFLDHNDRFEADRLLESVRGVLPYFAGSSMSASATVLALMLTVLGIGHRSEHSLSERFYRRIQWVGRQATVALGLAAVLLLTMAVPAAEVDAPAGATRLLVVQYYTTAVLTGLLVGILVSMVLMLESTLTGLVCVLGLRHTDHWAVVDPDASEPPPP